MLGGIRAAQSTFIGKALTTLVFGFILVAFVIWGIGDPFRGGGANAVAQVGGVSVSTAEFRQAYVTELQDLQRRLKRPVTNDEAHRFGLDAQVLSRLVSDAALDDRAQALDLAISDRQIAKAILADRSFAGPGGGFDRSRFDDLLSRRGLNEQGFSREERRTSLRREIVTALVGGLDAPVAAIDALHRYLDESRSIDMVALPAAAAGPIAPPDDAAIQAYYDAHKAAFGASQYRRLVVLALTPASVAKPDAVSDVDAQALYDKVKARRFVAPERRHVEQIVFPSEAEAAAFLGHVNAGVAFADAVKADGLSEKVLDLGTVARDAIFDHAVADAAFGLPVAGTSQPVKSGFGSVVVHVDAIEPASETPFADVSADLKREIAASRASAEVKRLQGSIEDARSSGKSLTEAAASAGFESRTIDAVDASGNDTSGKPVEGLVGGPALLKAAFASDIGVDNDTLSTADGGLVWFEVAGIDPARQLTLAEARAKVGAAWLEEETARRLDARAAELVRDIDAGRQTIEGAAASLGLAVQHVGDAKRAGSAALPQAVAARVFDVGVGGAGSAATGPESRTLFKVLDSATSPLDPDAPATKQLQERYRASLQDEIIGDYLGQLRVKLGTKVNQAAVASAAGTP